MNLVWLWCRPAVTAPIPPLAWKLPYAADVALKRQKTKKTKAKFVPPALLCWPSPVLLAPLDFASYNTNLLWLRALLDATPLAWMALSRAFPSLPKPMGFFLFCFVFPFWLLPPEFWGQGSNPPHSSDSAISLTHCTTRSL